MGFFMVCPKPVVPRTVPWYKETIIKGIGILRTLIMSRGLRESIFHYPWSVG